MESAWVHTPLGTAEIAGDERGLTRISISGGKIFSPAPVPRVLQEAAEQLEQYFRGDLKEFRLKLHPAGTPFQKKVWEALAEIPYGKTLSYLDLAHKIGAPKAVRAVAAANGRNPLWIVLPCHRVIGSDGSLTGYAGGLWRKRWLLEQEGALRQQRLFKSY